MVTSLFPVKGSVCKIKAISTGLTSGRDFYSATPAAPRTKPRFFSASSGTQSHLVSFYDNQYRDTINGHIYLVLLSYDIF